MAADGSLIFDTGLDSSGFLKGVTGLKATAAAAAIALTASFATAASAAVSVGTAFTSSMSQVAATMGITSAAEDYEVLSDAAKEMGATTKYSASQAADALNYLALAGYDAQKSVEALPTVLDLAAAGGIDLAYASDMVTDSMSALGLGMDELESFADKLAKTSQKSNTSVAQLGEAILTVGGTAKSLSGGVTELNTMLGAIADNGIKGAEGGTVLRNVILSLSAPTDTAAAAMERLSVSAFDAEGNMRYLPDVFEDFSTALENMSAAERTQILSDIFNKVDLKAVNALLGTSAERFDELSGYIDNCSGAASDMAKTMSDNLEGDMLAFQSALEAVGVSAFEKFEDPMRSAVQSVTADLASLNAEMSDGVLSDSMDKISASVGNLITKLGDFAADTALPSLINGLAAIIDNGDKAIAVLEAIAVAVIAFKALTVFNNFAGAIGMANIKLFAMEAELGKSAVAAAFLKGELSSVQIAAGLFTGKISAATVATKAFHAVAGSPVLLASILAAVVFSVAKYTTALAEATETTKAAIQAAEDYNLAMERQDQLISDNISQLESDKSMLKNKIAIYEELRKKYNETGENESELIQLTKEIQELSPITIDFIDKESQKYISLADSIDVVIAAMERKRQYENAESNYNAAQNELDDLYKQQAELLEERNRLESEYEQKYGKLSHNKFGDMLDVNIGFNIIPAGYAKNKIAENRKAIDEINDAIIDAQRRSRDAIDDIQSYYYDSMSETPPETKSWAEYIAENERAKSEKATAEYNAYIKNYTAAQLAAQQEATDNLEAGFEKLDHDYNTGRIASENELYLKKKALLDEYGNESLEDHWKFFEELYGYEKKFAEETATLNEETARKTRKGLEDDLSERKKAAQKTLSTVNDTLKSVLSEYESAYREYESKVASYKNKLLSVGDIFAFTSETDKNGNVTNTYAIENIREQMNQMEKYHSYVKKLKAEGASEGLLSELTSLDFEKGAEFGKYLTSMSDEKFAEINKLYNRRDELAQELAEDLYSGEAEQLNNTLMGCIDKALEKLPEAAQTAGKQMLLGLIAGMDITSDNISEQVDEFADNFKELYETAISELDLNEDFSALLSDVDAYGMGQSLGRDLKSGFSEELKKMQAEISAEQFDTAAVYKGSAAKNTAPSSESTKDDSITVEATIYTTVELDGEAIGKSVAKHQFRENRRQGK